MFLTLSQKFANICPIPPIKGTCKMLFGTSATFLWNTFLENTNNLEVSHQKWPKSQPQRSYKQGSYKKKRVNECITGCTFFSIKEKSSIEKMHTFLFIRTIS